MLLRILRTPSLPLSPRIKQHFHCNYDKTISFCYLFPLRRADQEAPDLPMQCIRMQNTVGSWLHGVAAAAVHTHFALSMASIKQVCLHLSPQASLGCLGAARVVETAPGPHAGPVGAWFPRKVHLPVVLLGRLVVLFFTQSKYSGISSVCSGTPVASEQDSKECSIHLFHFRGSRLSAGTAPPGCLPAKGT